MASFEMTGMDELVDLFEKMPQAVERAVPEMLKAGAKILEDEQKQAAREMGIEDSGGLIKSIKPTKIKKDGSETYIEVYPQGKAKHGNDRKGVRSNVRHATIGFVEEYGTTRKQARPFLSVATARAENKIAEKQEEIFRRETGL